MEINGGTRYGITNVGDGISLVSLALSRLKRCLVEFFTMEHCTFDWQKDEIFKLMFEDTRK